MTLLIVYVGIALGFSFLCSVLEAVLLSVSPAYLAKLREDNPKLGERLTTLKAEVDRPLAAILSLNTIAHTVGAAGAGAQAQALWGSEILTVASAVLTLLILIVSEIIPKTLGAVHYKRLAGFTATTLPLLVKGLFPLVWLSELITKLISDKGGAHGKLDAEEIAALTQMGAEEGLFDPSESRILRVLFKVKDLRAADIMTPRTVISSLPSTETVKAALERKDVLRFSRIPVWGRDADDLKGYVLKDELLLRAARDELDRKVGSFTREILVVSPDVGVPDLFERLLDRNEHIGAVVDQFGALQGVVTMEDVIETLLGREIVDEADAVEDMRAMARKRWFERAHRFNVASDEVLDELEAASGKAPWHDAEDAGS